ncbi:MAG TPA: tripartite tricarboxylate transporter substrate binding protein [Reyranella sp.]
MQASSSIALVIVSLAAWLSPAAAQDYPNRPIRMIVAFAAGGTTDFVARLIADKAKGTLGQNIVVENRPGANGAIGADYVAKSEPDGYTLFFSTAGAITINPSLRSDLPYDPVRDFAPVAPIARNTVLFAAGPALKVDAAQDMLALARAKPGAITVAITGVGAISHLAIELLQHAAGIKLQYVPYRGAGQAISDFIGGQVNAMSAEVPVLMPQLKTGKAKVLAVAAQNRSDVLPDVPTFAELGFADVVADNWSGALAPARTPPVVIAKLNAALNAAVHNPETRAKLADNGVSATGGSPEDLIALIAAETARWRKVVKEIGVKVQAE